MLLRKKFANSSESFWYLSSSGIGFTADVPVSSFTNMYNFLTFCPHSIIFDVIASLLEWYNCLLYFVHSDFRANHVSSVWYFRQALSLLLFSSVVLHLLITKDTSFLQSEIWFLMVLPHQLLTSV